MILFVVAFFVTNMLERNQDSLQYQWRPGGGCPSLVGLDFAKESGGPIFCDLKLAFVWAARLTMSADFERTTRENI